MTIIMHAIYINGRFLTQNITGVQRYARQLVMAFDNMIHDGTIDTNRYRLAIVAPSNVDRQTTNGQIEIISKGRIAGHFWEQVTLPYSTRGGILLSPGNVGPVYHENHIVTIHDTAVLAMPKTFSWAFRTWYSHIMKALCRTARHIITVSQFSKSEIIKYLQADPDKISVVYHGHEHCLAADSQSDILTEYNLEKNSYILAVGSLNRRKNFHAVLKAMRLIKNHKIKIVIAGDTNPRVFGDSDMVLPDEAIYPGRISDADLAALYKNAAAFVYPSLYEGFGLPPLEAMAHGCPVIVSDIPPHHEVCGEAALYFEPDQPEFLADQIDNVISDESLHTRMSQNSMQQASLYTWEKCAHETWALLTRLADFGI